MKVAAYVVISALLAIGVGLVAACSTMKVPTKTETVEAAKSAAVTATTTAATVAATDPQAVVTNPAGIGITWLLTFAAAFAANLAQSYTLRTRATLTQPPPPSPPPK